MEARYVPINTVTLCTLNVRTHNAARDKISEGFQSLRGVHSERGMGRKYQVRRKVNKFRAEQLSFSLNGE